MTLGRLSRRVLPAKAGMNRQKACRSGDRRHSNARVNKILAERKSKAQ
jgi:hypothetical protein